MSTKDLIVRKVEPLHVFEWIEKKHYARRLPSISHAFGLYKNAELIGICTFGVPPSPPLLKGICGDEYKKKVLELNRLCMEDGLERNATSFFVSRCLKSLPPETIVVSFADTSVGHIGYIYQACNFIYTGLSAKRTDWKIRGLEHLHGATIADKSRGEKNRVEYMRETYGRDFYLKDRPRKHRYIYFVGDKRWKKKVSKALRYSVLPYPKGESKKYDAGYKPDKQLILI